MDSRSIYNGGELLLRLQMVAAHRTADLLGLRRIRIYKLGEGARRETHTIVT